MKSKTFSNPKKALLVIDIQEDYTGATATPPFPYKESERLIQTVNALVEKADQAGMVIIYIRQEFTGFAGTLVSKLLLKGRSIQGKPGTEIDQRIKILSKDIFPKPMASAFSNPRLERFLDEEQVTEVYLTGLDAQFCVHETGKAGLKLGYQVTILRDAVLARNEDKWPALLKTYEREGIKLMESKELS